MHFFFPPVYTFMSQIWSLPLERELGHSRPCRVILERAKNRRWLDYLGVFWRTGLYLFIIRQNVLSHAFGVDKNRDERCFLIVGTVHHCLKKMLLFFTPQPPPVCAGIKKKKRRLHLVSLFGIILISARPANPLCRCIIHGAPLTKFPFMWAARPERKSSETGISPNGLYLMATAQLGSGKLSFRLAK